MKTMVQSVIWLLVLAAITAAVLTLLLRPAAAAACPQCFGLSKAADGVYLQSGMAEAQRSRALAAVAAARSGAGKFYGGLQHAPRILVCADDDCYHRLGGQPGTAVGSLGSLSLEVSSQGVNPVYIAAGLSRAELEGRIGFWKFQLGAVPVWFDEGLAVVVADDPAYVLPPGRRDRCLTGALPDMPATPTEWRDEMQQEGSTALYAQAACKTVSWMDQHGGPQAVTGLLDKVAHGEDFAALVPPR